MSCRLGYTAGQVATGTSAVPKLMRWLSTVAGSIGLLSVIVGACKLVLRETLIADSWCSGSTGNVASVHPHGGTLPCYETRGWKVRDAEGALQTKASVSSVTGLKDHINIRI